MAILSWQSYLTLLACCLSPAIIAIILHYFLKRWKWFNSLNYWIRQVSIGLIFSGLALCSFYFGVEYSTIDPSGLYKDVVGNFGSANASPLIAGLVFGGPSGFIAGFAAGIYRLVIYPFGSGDYLRAAECITVLASGGLAWLLRATLFDNKKPRWFYGLIIGMLIETFHMLLIFTVSIAQVDSVYAYGIIRVCDIPCFVTVGLSVALTLIGISLLEKEKLINKVKGGDKRIATKIQRWMGLTFVIAIIVTFSFTYWGNYQKTAYDISQNLNNANYDARVKIQCDENVKVFSDFVDSSKDYLKAAKDSGTYQVCKYQRIGKMGYTVLLDYDSKRIVSIPYETLEKPTTYDNKIGVEFPVDTIYPDSKTAHLREVEGVMYYLKWEEIKLNKTYDGKSHELHYIAVALISRSEARLELGIVVRLTSYLELLVLIGIFAVIYIFIKKVVVKNVYKINDSLDKITGGNLNTKVNVRSNKEFSDLSDDINQTVDSLKHFIDEANKRIDDELKYAKEIQQSALPLTFPTTNLYDLHACMHTAKQVGGDFYDFFNIDKKHVFISMADVSGKGIPAAMFMMRAKTLVKSLIEANELKLDHVINMVNEELNKDNKTGMFVTAWFGILNTETGVVEFVNCGHCNPLVGKSPRFNYLKMEKNCVLGVIPNMKYKLEKVTLKSNDSIILYTDGVTEATSKNKKLFGEAKLKEVVNKAKTITSKELLDVIHKEVDKFQHGAEQADDITMLMIKFKGKK